MRDYNILLAIKREINLRTRSASLKEKKYTRKIKYKERLA
jgi:hypothetical protein